MKINHTVLMQGVPEKYTAEVPDDAMMFWEYTGANSNGYVHGILRVQKPDGSLYAITPAVVNFAIDGVISANENKIDWIGAE